MVAGWLKMAYALCLCASIAQGVDQLSATVHVYPTLSVRGKADGNSEAGRFELHRWNSHHGVYDQINSASLISTGTRPGRSLGSDTGVFPLVPEDPHRPGFGDLSWFKTSPEMAAEAGKFIQGSRDVGGDNYSLILCFDGAIWPTYLGWENGTNTLPINVKGAAEFAVAYIKAIYEASGLLPRYVEPVNEPNGGNIASGANSSLVKSYQEEVAIGIKNYLASIKMSDAVLVGGPAYAGIGFAHNKYRGLQDLFWDGQQFVSFHIFSNFAILPDGSPFETLQSGAPLVTSFDTVEAYSLSKYGKVLPILPSEHGLATDGDPKLPKVVNISTERALQIHSYWAQILGLFERGGNILALNAFLIDNRFACKNNPSVSLMNCTRAVPTIVANATFGLMKHLDGLVPIHRLVQHSDSNQFLLAESFSESGEFVLVLLKNLDPSSIIVNVSLPGEQLADGTVVSITRVGIDGEFLPSIVSSNISFSDLSDLDLKGREFVMIHIPTRVKPTKQVLFRRHYANIVGVTIPQNGSIETNIEIDNNNNNVLQAVLRIGYAQDFGANASSDGTVPIPLIEAPCISVNNQLLTSPMALKAADRLAPKASHWYGQRRSWEYSVPNISVQNVNSIKAKFNLDDLQTNSVINKCLTELYYILNPLT